MKRSERILRLFVLSAVVCATPLPASNSQTVVLTPELQRFVEKGTRPIEIERADLNGDGRSDFILVIENLSPADATEEIERTLLIIVRESRGTLRVAARSDSAVRDDLCGGTFGDCFQGVSAKTKAFTISEFGGSGSRWSRESTFRFSSRDQTWQLVRVEESEFHVRAPDKIKRKVYVPPRDFGKIDISEYYAMEFLGTGSK
jgi:hypothetical protein